MIQKKAITIEKNGAIIGAAFPHFTFRIVEVPFYDPDRDGQINGSTYAIKFEHISTGPFKGISKELWGPGIGLCGSIGFLRHQLRAAVDQYNA